ncbi:SusC/RagA family TonB-linked outer membrane protein [Pedobacter sp. P351]|uniref:SusC/RagA family TonB-linked outer membrane protein n=1 Tax=Pedobacter superstes TaxID=3133441 RepID=UPI0030B771FC
MFKLRLSSVSFPVLMIVGLVSLDQPASAQENPEKAATNADSIVQNFRKSIPQNTQSTEADVNIGYQRIKRENISGSVVPVQESQIRGLMPISIDALLQGQVAGMHVVNTSGAPGSGAISNIRGISTFNAATAPLYIIDGVPVKVSRSDRPLALNADNNPLADINPEDIAAITVLKDAYATAIYGMRGANGVIVLDTYGGTTGKTYLDFSGTTGIMNAPDPVSVFNAEQYRAFMLEKEQARGLTQQQIENGSGRYLLISTPPNQTERYNNNTNWQDEITKGGLYNNYHLKLRGGDAIARYSLNVGYTKQGGVVENTDYSRFTTRLNLDYKVGRKISFLNSVSFTRSDKTLKDEGGNFNTNPLYLAVLKSPTLTPFQQDMSGLDTRDIDSADYAGRSNPYSVINKMSNKNSTNRIVGRITGQYTFSPYLNLRLGLAADLFRLRESRFRPSAGFLPERHIIRASSENNGTEIMMMNENVLSYNKTFGEHAVSAFAGNAFQTTAREVRYAMVVNSPSDEFNTISTDNKLLLDSLSSSDPRWRLLSFFGHAQYAYRGKYSVGANLRTDGSSRFVKGKRWGYFPSISASWLISEEPFLKESTVVNQLKLRTSYGLSGNEEVGHIGAYNALVTTPYSGYAGVRFHILGNPDLQWEETRQFNVGLDFSVLNRLALSVDVYNKKTVNLLNTINLPTINGIGTYLVSSGAVRNHGIEFSITGKVLTGAFNWQTNITAAQNRNEILSLPDLMNRVTNYDNYQGIVQVGNSVGAFYGYNALGVYANSSDVKVKNGAENISPFQGGDIQFEDADNNGIIDEGDMKVIGNTNPDVFGGFSNVFSFRRLDLNVFMDFAVGNHVYNARRASLESMATYDNQSVTVSNRWKQEGDIAEIPRAVHGDAVGNSRFSSRWLEDGSFARFKAITLGYNLPAGGLGGTFKSARIHVTAQNLYTFTKYKGYGPEVGSAVNATMYGVDYGNLPQLRSFLIGVKLGL